MLVLKIALSLLMAFAGGVKILGVQHIASQFEEFGLPRWTMYLVGVLELAAGVGVHVEALAFIASSGLALLMVGAIANHVKVKHALAMSVPSFLVLVLAGAHSLLTWRDVFSIAG